MMRGRFRQLRLARGLSLEALAGEMGNIVTKQALSKYENGRAVPSNRVLTKLAGALGVKAAYFWQDPQIDVEFLAYRKGSRLPKKEQERIESLVSRMLEERIRLRELLHGHEKLDLPIRAFKVTSVSAAERAAERLRDEWSLGRDPISSVVDVLEDHNVYVLEIETQHGFDGISAMAREGRSAKAAAVVCKKGLPGERQRLSLVHELGHLVSEIRTGVDGEKAAFRFGAAFLAPASVVRKEVGDKRAFIQPSELLLLKKRYGLSIQALLYRLRDLRIITESYYRQWCIDIGRLGWRKQEPIELPQEKPTWLRQNALRAFSEGAITKEAAEELVGKSVDGVPLSLLQRRALMKLSLSERRRVLARQAAQLVTHYEEVPRPGHLQEGEFVEY